VLFPREYSKRRVLDLASGYLSLERGEAHKQLINIIFLQRGVESTIVQSGIILVSLAEALHVLRALICSRQLYCSRMGEPLAIEIPF
jgi:hypothetical protein